MMTEFDIIRRYFLDAVMPDYVQLGPGDDCAVLTVPADKRLCVSTDTLLVGVHFPHDANPAVVASRACGANLSDLAAMGAKPHAMTVALTLPEADETWIKAFSAAMFGLAELHHCPIVGGNLTKGDLSITLTVMGVTDQPILRSEANAGDDIYVTGSLGDAAGAVEQLGSKSPCDELLARYNTPEPRLEVGASLHGLATAMIDISDGFLADLNHLTESSDLGAEIDVTKLPISKALVQAFGAEDATPLALYGGDDYELCFTASQNQRRDIEQLSHKLGTHITLVGKTVKSSGIKNQLGEAMLTKGYEHF